MLRRTILVQLFLAQVLAMMLPGAPTTASDLARAEAARWNEGVRNRQAGNGAQMNPDLNSSAELHHRLGVLSQIIDSQTDCPRRKWLCVVDVVETWEWCDFANRTGTHNDSPEVMDVQGECHPPAHHDAMSSSGQRLSADTLRNIEDNRQQALKRRAESQAGKDSKATKQDLNHAMWARYIPTTCDEHHLGSKN